MRRIGGLGSIVLLGCTSSNPAFEDDGGAQDSSSAGSGGSSSTRGSAEAGPSSITDSMEGTGEATGGSMGSVGTGPSDATSDATGSDATTGDTGSQDPPQVGPFGPPELLPLPISDLTFEDDDPTLTGDMLELFFASRRVGGMGEDDIWVVRREAIDQLWDLPTPVSSLNTFRRENTPEISLDGLTMLLASTRHDTTDESIYVSTRADRDPETPWSEPVLVVELSSPERDVCPFPTADGLHVYMCGGVKSDTQIVRFDRVSEKAPWMGPFPVDGVNTAEFECGPWLDPTAHVISWMTDRDDAGNDLWIAQRPSHSDPFEDAMPLANVNMPGTDDDDPWISPDGGTLFFASGRLGTMDLYVAHRVME